VERKLATVLFVDLVSSTEQVAGADPEVVRRRVTRFFEQVSQCIVTHGGTVEKFAGDAVMAAFGVPLAHEDDAERAVRAAVAMLDRVRGLGLEARIGIESGEVVAEDADSTFATGEAVNLAARLQQHARANEILVGPGSAALLRDRVELEALNPIELRGWSEPVRAHRVLCVVELGEPVRGLSAPFVGRDSELELLENTYGRTVRDRRAALLTVYGEPGVGKSRLAREFLAGLEGATILSGRCLPYGEGVTYWPLAEMVKASAGIADDDPLDQAQAKLRACCEDEAVADLLGLAVGVLEAVEGERSQQEIAWAARAWAEQLAAAQPLVLVFEDVHWGEEPLLELIEHLATAVREQPLLLLCLARPELLDVRPTWGGGRVRATTLELEALQPEESAELVAALADELDLPVDLDRVLAKSEGNPLFVEETVRMLAEHGGGAERIPDTLQALIAARIDRLPAAQRLALQRASVMGRIFMHGALAHLSPEIDDVGHCLDELLLRDLVVREPRATIRGEQSFKFKHVLIREVAYAGLSKAARADLHQAYARWLTENAGDELLEIRGFHLDQATRLLAELDGAPPPELAEETAAVLEHAGRRALSREAFRSARRLFLRAVELEPTLLRRFYAARAAWRLGDLPAVAVEMEAVREEAARKGDRLVHGRALTALAEATLYHAGDALTARVLAEQALEVLADEAPDVRFDAVYTRASIGNWIGDADDFERHLEEALALAREAERKDLEGLVTERLAQSNLMRLDLEAAGPLVARSLELVAESGSVVARASAEWTRGLYEYVRGDLEAAGEACVVARRLYAEVGLSPNAAAVDVYHAKLLHEEGREGEAERLLREAIPVLKGVRDRAYLWDAQRLLAQVLLADGRVSEAERLVLEARETVTPQDRLYDASTKLALALVRAAQQRDAEAEELLLEALAGFDAFNLLIGSLEALRELTRFLRARGREAEAERYEERLGELAPASAAPIA
jgi:class 3 adenylate cyclase